MRMWNRINMYHCIYVVAMLPCYLSFWCVSAWLISAWVWDFTLQQDLGKPSRGQPSQVIGVGSSQKHPRSHGGHMWIRLLWARGKEGWTLLQCWRCLVAQHFLLLIKKDNPSIQQMYLVVWIINPIFSIRKLKISHKNPQGICICSWYWHCHKQLLKSSELSNELQSNCIFAHHWF